MSGTELSGDFHLGRSLVDGDNGMGSGEGGALKDIETDAAAAVDGEALAGADLSGVGHGANAGGHSTAYEGGDVERQVAVDGDAGFLRRNAELGESREGRKLADACAAESEAGSAIEHGA